MKRVILLLLPFLFLMSCTSSKKYLEKGNYTMAVKKSVTRLQKKSDREKEIWVLTQALPKANQENLDRIAYLKKTGQPDIWEEVNMNYRQLKNRQDLVNTLPPVVLEAIGFKYVNYDSDIAESEKKACEYFYAHAKQLLSKNDKMLARQAYDELNKIKNYYNDYKDVNTLISQAAWLGTTRVLFFMENNSNSLMPAAFEQDFMSINLSDLDTKWVEYHTRVQENVQYDYTIGLSIRNIDVSPERIRERSWTESRQIEDGWTYLYDSRGNVMKDSLGNDIKVIKYVTVVCHLVEVNQAKEALLAGKLTFTNNATNQMLDTEPVSAKSVFGNNYIIANGDLRALTPATRNRLGSTPVPFPGDFDMIMMAREYLQQSVRSVIRSRSYLIK